MTVRFSTQKVALTNLADALHAYAQDYCCRVIGVSEEEYKKTLESVTTDVASWEGKEWSEEMEDMLDDFPFDVCIAAFRVFSEKSDLNRINMLLSYTLHGFNDCTTDTLVRDVCRAVLATTSYFDFE